MTLETLLRSWATMEGQGPSSTRFALSEADVVALRRLRRAGVSYQVLADAFDIDIERLMAAIHGRTFVHVLSEPPVEECATAFSVEWASDAFA